MSKARQLTVRGTVQNEKTGAAIFNAKVRFVPTRASVQTALDGSFEIIIEIGPRARAATLIVLRKDHWARKVKIPIPENDSSVTCDAILLEEMAEVFTKSWYGYFISLFGPRLHSWVLSLTNMEQVLVSLVVFFLIPPALLLAVARGMPIPGTEWDEEAREGMLARQWWIAAPSELTFSRLRPIYRPHVKYRIPAGKYEIARDIVIEATSEVAIEKGTEFQLKTGAGFLVYGKLVARGEANAGQIKFVPKDAGRWGNITLWERGSEGSVLEHCVILHGGGRKATGSTLGAFLLDPAGGTSAGGGLLIYNSKATLTKVEIADCEAANGGGIYLRNTAANLSLPGSVFTETVIRDCHAIRLVANKPEVAAGGGVYVQRTFPEFKDCRFEKNRVEGPSSCGGGAYVGFDARAKFENCVFEKNEAAGEGGGIYAFSCFETADDYTSGVIVRGGQFLGNIAHGTGGGLSASNTRVWISSAQFRGNRVQEFTFPNRDALASGGGVALNYDDSFRNGKNLRATMLERCLFEDNRAERGPAAPNRPANYAGGGLAIMAMTTTPVKLYLAELTFNNNDAANGRQAAASPAANFDGWSGRWEAASVTPGVLALPDSTFVFAGLVAAAPTIDRSRQLPATCFGDRPATAVINSVVLHFISAAGIRGASRYDLDTILGIFTATSAPGEKTSSHYLIDREGRIFGLVPESKSAWHAGLSQMPTGEERVNEFSIGIEMMFAADEPPTEAQYQSLVTLLLDLKRRHPAITPDRIVGHETVRALWNHNHPGQVAPLKPDPGPLFHWARVIRQIPAK